MRLFANSSLVFRLWVTLSLLAAAFSTLALGTYTWLAVGDSINAAHTQIEGKVRVLQASVNRMVATGNQPAAGEVVLAEELGLRSLRFIDADGRDVVPTQFGSLTAQDADGGAAFIASSTPERPAARRVRIDNGDIVATALSPLDVIRGGTFGEEYSLTVSHPQGQGPPIRMAIVLEYPDISREASVIIARSLWAGVVIVSATVVGMWLALRIFVTGPLRRYSHLARLIAGGDPVRIPTPGSDELNQLGRALNGMADALQHEASVDSLTGLYNLRHLSTNLETLIKEAEAEKKPLSVIVGDLDNLKPVNDTYGHLVGDRLLQAVSETLRAWSGHRFTCWRLGGDEFAVAMPRLEEEQARSEASELRQKISTIRLSGQSQVRASISLGVASYPKDGETADALLAAADLRMYALKALGSEERRRDAVPATSIRTA